MAALFAARSNLNPDYEITTPWQSTPGLVMTENHDLPAISHNSQPLNASSGKPAAA
jgi:hypothetical protein